MTGTNGYPIRTGIEDYLRQQEKATMAQQRIPVPTSATALLGPGMSSQAVHIMDLNDELATFNGYFYTSPGAYNTPELTEQAYDDVGNPVGDPVDLPDLSWSMQVVARDDGTGMQQVWNTDDPTKMHYRVRNYWPNPLDPSAPVIFGEWRRYASPSGGVEMGDLSTPVSGRIDQAYQTALDALATAEEAMGFILPLNVVFRQPSAPTGTPDRALRENDFWFDTDDGNHMYVYQSGAWVDVQDADIAAAAAAAAAAQAAASAAATDAANAAAFAASKSKVFWATTAPTATATDDIWFDTDDGRKPYRWDGSAWVSSTTAWLQTNPSASFPGMTISPTGLAAYDAAGTLTFSVTSATGAILTVGNVATGGSLTGAVVTGGTVQSESTASRGIKMNSTALVAYNASGVATFTITAATGAVAMLGSLLSGSDVTGATVTGGTVQTIVTAARGIKLTGSSLAAYNSSGTLVTSINATTGIISTTGAVYTGGAIDGATVTGGTLQTEATASRGIKINSTGFTAYDAAGSPTFTITASTGAVAMLGTLTSGSTVSGATITGGTVYGATVATSAPGVGNRAVLAANSLSWDDGFGGSNGSITAGGRIITIAAPVAGGSVVRITGPEFQVLSTLSSFDNPVDFISSVDIGGQVTVSSLVQATKFNATNPPTGTAIPNARWNSSAGGDLFFTSHANSSVRYKRNIEPLTSIKDSVLAVEPVTYEMREQPIDRPEGYRFVGFVAEQMHDLGFGQWLGYDEQGRPDEVDYAKWPVAQQAVLIDHEKRIAALEHQIEHLRGYVTPNG